MQGDGFILDLFSIKVLNTLPFRAPVVCGTLNPGVPLRSAPGYELVAPAGRTHKNDVFHAKICLALLRLLKASCKKRYCFASISHAKLCGASP